MAGNLHLWSGKPNIRGYPEGGSTQTFQTGDLVFFSSGSVIIATDGDDVVGVAADDATGTTGSPIRVSVVTPEQVWSVRTTGATPAVASHQGLIYDFSDFTAGAMLLNLGSSGTDIVLVDLDPRDVPASGTRVLVRFSYDSCWNLKGS